MQYSIVQFSEVKNSPDFRIDAEYWRPDFIENSKLVSRGNPKIRDFTRRDIANIKSSPLGRGFEYLEISRISLSNCEYGTTRVEVGEEPDRAHHILKKNDIAVSTVRPNRNAVALIRDDGIVGSSGLSVLRANPHIAAEYLLAFCKTGYFINCLMRADKASMYPAVLNKDVLDIPLPVPSPQFGAQIAESVRNSISRIDDAQNAYRRAEALLLSSLGLADWLPEDRLWFVKDYAEVREAARFDADYFQPKYDEIINAVKACPGGWDALGNLVSMRKCIEVGSAEYLGEGVPFVRVSDLGPFEIAREKYISESLYSRIREHQPEAGEILFSKDATPGIAHYLREEPERMIPSGGILRLKSKTDKVSDEYLTFALNSICTREQVNRDVGGSVILHWRPEQAMRTAIPILPRETQAEIRRMAVESFRLRAESGRLLERAKRAVEIAIEENEEAAREWLAKETGETA